MVYVGPLMSCLPNRRWHWGEVAHLEADMPDELDAFALSIGLELGWRQKGTTRHPWPHYDLTQGMMQRALAAGATRQTGRECVDRWKRWREQAPKGAEGSNP